MDLPGGRGVQRMDLPRGRGLQRMDLPRGRETVEDGLTWGEGDCRGMAYLVGTSLWRTLIFCLEGIRI